MMSETKTGKIHAALADAMAEVGGIAKTQKNPQGWTSRGIDQVYDRVHGIFVEHRIVSRSEIMSSKRRTYNIGSEAKPRLMFATYLRVRYHFEADDGSSKWTEVESEASSYGDKATGAAMSYAHKYAILQLFVVPCTDIPDPDKEHPGQTADGKPLVTGRVGKTRKPTKPHPAAPKTGDTASGRDRDKLKALWKRVKDKPQDEAEKALQEFDFYISAQFETKAYSEAEYKKLGENLDSCYAKLKERETSDAA